MAISVGSDFISIHSTTRVETSDGSATTVQAADFNPLHHEGGDRFVEFQPVEPVPFQSTPPRGWRHKPVNGQPVHVHISIHSTTRVETVSGMIFMTVKTDFNPLHHEGGDIDKFTAITLTVDFNPLHHEGGDKGVEVSKFSFTISIHSTTRVETYCLLKASATLCISIHSTTRVETRI